MIKSDISLSLSPISAPFTQTRINFQAKPQPCPKQSTLRPEMRPSEGKLSALFVPKAKGPPFGRAKGHVRKKHPVPVMHGLSFVRALMKN
ncbi:hypothetical protein FVEG_16140 [Fusarium verticillioides 7600]|uniref:Uncharacterized protein n=1 Tax=Gibberella moniliformis (strain M3125 / FGSC 7600) TaxID=334819 RepID=W7MSE1_GIBM7|nr:hypothetical protein FVEG_16140 [Fusarium verticillioides 7600]EWG47477.1 hypothetical protein FVEG_16140 [Fusarium verticillioides 7600]